MNEYELMLLTSADLDDEARGAILTRSQEVITKAGGKWVNMDDWGRRKLSYEIEKKTEAHYSLLFFDCDGPTLDELSRVLSITEGVMRVLAVNRVPALPEGVVLEVYDENEDRDRGGRGRGRGGGGRDRDRGGDRERSRA